jgi:hypothetical protein
MPDRLDPTFLRAQIELLRRAHPDLWDENEQVLLDALEGQTELFEFLTVALRQMYTAKAYATGLKRVIVENFQPRQERYEQREQTLRTLMFRIMTAADIHKIEVLEATLSIRAGVPRVIITDETLLPPDCVRVRTEPDKVRIKERLARGETVAGAELSNSEPTLAVRVK